MSKMLIALPLLAPALLLAAGCADTPPTQSQLRAQARDAAKLEETLAGFTAGKPDNCVENRDLQGPEAYGENTLLFRTSRKLIWRTETSGSCDDIKRGDALITHQYSSRLCQGDIARTADLRAGFQTGSCVIGEFVPYRK